MAYPNGRIPLSLLVHLGGDHYLPPGTAARWRWLVQAAYEKYGVRLRITQGPNAYRWYEAQVEAKEEACARGRCQDAAAPGFSSHGGLFEGRQVMAADVANWQELGSTPSGKDAWGRFEALCRLAGFTVLFFDWEPWHITDFNDPWTVPDWAAGKTPLTPESEEDEMKNSCVYYQKDNAWIYLVFNTGSGWYHEYSNGPGEGTMPGEYNNPLAATLGTGSFAKVTASHAGVIKTSLDAVRRTTLAGEVTAFIKAD